MKKNVLALSITAALVGLTGGAHAMTGALGGASALVQEFNGQGVGHSLVVPYFSTQGNNNTLINLVNTDLYNGKAVKVRFRGAANSDDIFDFQVFLSPGDVWTANIAQGADGRSRLLTNDASCTKPDKATLNSTSFITARLDQTMTDAQKANGTREGYVEIFNMADIPRAGIAALALDAAKATAAGFPADSLVENPLWKAIKHVGKVAPCGAVDAAGSADSKLAAAAWAFLDSNATGSTNLKFDTVGPAANTGAVNAGLLPPTTGLMANWTIINVVGAAAWSGEAVAVEARDVAGTVATSPTTGVVGERVNTGNVVYWPQTAVGVGAAPVEFYSADALFRGVGNTDIYTIGTTNVLTKVAAPAIAAAFYDLPDMSTPYIVLPFTTTSPLTQARTLTNSLATKSVRNEYFTDTGVSASTDWLFSLPTRRYSVAYDYSFDAATAADTATNDGRRFTDINGDPTFALNAHFAPSNTKVSSTTNGNGRQICVVLASSSLASYDREESKPGAAQIGVVISPSTPNAVPKFNICGEAAILSINNGGILPTGTGALKASVAVQDTTLLYKDGWATFSTPAAVGTTIGGLPVLGSSFSRALGNAGGQTFGISSNHRFQR